MNKVDEVIKHYDSQIESLIEEIEECEQVLYFLNRRFNWLEDKFKFKKNVSLSAKSPGMLSREGEIGLSDRILANMMYGIEREKRKAEELISDCKERRDEELAEAIIEDKELEE